jgi:hypothetical protein
MKKLLLIIIAAFALGAIPVVYADDELPEIAPVDDPAVPSLDAPAPADAAATDASAAPAEAK